MNSNLKLIKRELIFNPDFPAYAMCHASNIHRLSDGTILAAWFAGSEEGADDVGIWTARRSAGIWSAPRQAAGDGAAPCWNPIIFAKHDGSVLLLYKKGREINTWKTMVRESFDQGVSWGEEYELVPGDQGGRGPVRCKMISLSDQTILAGSSVETGEWIAYADKSRDEGKTWKRSNPVRIDVAYNGEKTAADSTIKVSEQSFYGRGVIQPSLWESQDGNVHMLLRSSESRIYRADSNDYGETWGRAYPTELPNNNSGIDVVKSEKHQMLVLCSNPIAVNWGERTPLTLAVSYDNGSTWSDETTLEQLPGEYSYPSIICHEDSIYVSYTYDRKSIAFCEYKIRKREEL